MRCSGAVLVFGVGVVAVGAWQLRYSNGAAHFARTHPSSSSMLVVARSGFSTLHGTWPGLGVKVKVRVSGQGQGWLLYALRRQV